MGETELCLRSYGWEEAQRLTLCPFSTQTGHDSTMVSVESGEKYPSFSLQDQQNLGLPISLDPRTISFPS
jgi:hypothetical protein